MYKGTYDGDKEEVKFVAEFNSDKSRFNEYLANFSEYKDIWMVRVTTRQYSELSDCKVYTRSDCYLANIDSDITDILKKNDYLLSETLLDDNKIPYIKIPYSGISIKMSNSNNYQILKITPDSFKKLFNSSELGAGASLFCKKEKELNKNINLISGWNSSVDKMTEYFLEFTKGNNEFHLNQEICKNIKNDACDKIKEQIENNIDLHKKIFNGIGLYKEPYTAFYFSQNSKIKELTTIPFHVTTGSGRSKGQYTIVLKPTKHK